MQNRSVLWLMLSLLLWAGPDLSLQTTIIDELSAASFILSPGAAKAGGILTLDSRASDATAIYKDAVPDLASSSFSTVFTFSTNASYGNGTFAFVIVPSGSLADGLKTAEQTLSVEFTSTYYNLSSDDNGDDGPGNGRGWPGYHGYGGVGKGGGLQQVSDYVGGEFISQLPIWTFPPGCYAGGPGAYFCPVGPAAIDPSLRSFQYEMALEYNLTTRTLAVGTLDCASTLDPSISTFATFLNYSVDLSSVVQGSMYVGFVASGHAIFNVSQWNFTTNPSSSIMASLALQTSSANSGTGNDGTTAGSGNGGSSKLGKGYVIAFSLIGAGIGVATVLLVCFLCRRKPRPSSTSRVRGEIPEGAIMFDAAKATPPPRKDRDTAPLQPRPANNSSDFALTGTASWLKPVNAR